jgi:cellulose synthase/poly-beta-1,6-N-acetylglucosamine synthase-like glycosyltransferase
MIIIYICTISVFIVICRGLFFSFGAFLERRKHNLNFTNSSLPMVSVIVPARNEEQHIANCLESIARNNYPIDKFEIIAVDDRSNDNTANIIKGLSEKYLNVKLLQVFHPSTEINLQGKPGALQAGIDIAIGDILLFTDADCIVGENWIRTITDVFQDKSIGLVCSFTYIDGKKFFDIYQSIEWIYMHALGAAGIATFQPLGCFGNNLALRRSDFMKFGGFRGIEFSVTEDLALLQTMIANNKKARHLCNPDSKVITAPCKTIKEYLSQHHRWAIGGLNLGWRATFFILSSVAFWVAVILGAIFLRPEFIALVLAARMIGDLSIIYPSLKALKLSKFYKSVILSDLLMIIIEVTVPFLLLDKEIVWKDQVFRTE